MTMTMSIHQAALIQIEAKRQRSVFPVHQNGKLSLPTQLPTRVEGLYWIYTDYSEDDLIACIPSPQKKAINIRKLTAQHAGLKHICTIKHETYRLVYSGSACSGAKQEFGLRERILQHFNGGSGTGSLGVLKSSLNDLNRWLFSYVRLGTTPGACINAGYNEFGLLYERLWRLEYGWPLLCCK